MINLLFDEKIEQDMKEYLLYIVRFTIERNKNEHINHLSLNEIKKVFYYIIKEEFFERREKDPIFTINTPFNDFMKILFNKLLFQINIVTSEMYFKFIKIYEEIFKIEVQNKDELFNIHRYIEKIYNSIYELSSINKDLKENKYDEAICMSIKINGFNQRFVANFKVKEIEKLDNKYLKILKKRVYSKNYDDIQDVIELCKKTKIFDRRY